MSWGGLFWIVGVLLKFCSYTTFFSHKMKPNGKRKKTRKHTKTKSTYQEKTTKDCVVRRRLRRRTCMGPAETIHIIYKLVHSVVSVAANGPLSWDVEITAAIPTSRNHLYAKASHRGTLRAGRRTEFAIDMQILSSCPGAPQGCQKVDGRSLAKKRRLYIITCVLGWPVLDSRSFVESLPGTSPCFQT